MENPEIAQIFEEIADLLEIQGANTFRVRAYRNAARVVRDHPEALADLARDPSQIESLPGIGEDLRQAVIAQRIREIKGFGVKTEEAILRALEKPDQAAQRVYLADAKVFADAVVRHLKGTPGIGQLIVSGSLRRRLETVGDVDVLVTCPNA